MSSVNYRINKVQVLSLEVKMRKWWVHGWVELQVIWMMRCDDIEICFCSLLRGTILGWEP